MNLNLRKRSQTDLPFEELRRRYRLFVWYVPSDIRNYEAHSIEHILEKRFGGTFFDVDYEGGRLQFIYDNRNAVMMASSAISEYFMDHEIDGGWKLQCEVESPDGIWYPEHVEHLETEWNWEGRDQYIPDVEDLLFEEE